MGSLEGKIALVTGASRGAGRGIAVELESRSNGLYYGKKRARQSTKDWPGTLDETLSQIESCGGPAWRSVVIIPGMKKRRR